MVAVADVTDGDFLPGSPGARVRDFDARGFSIDEEGNVVFLARTGAYGIWAGKPGDLRLVAMADAAAPGGDGVGFGSLVTAYPGIHAGRASFAGMLDLPASALDRAFWQEGAGGGGLVLGAREGDPAPGSGTFEDFAGGPTVLTNGKTVFRAGLDGSRDGVYWGEPGAWQPVAVTGGPADGIPGATINSFRSFVAQPGGGFAYEAVVVPGFDSAIYYGRGDTAAEALVLGSDGTAPGTGGKRFSNQFSLPSVGADGSVAITAVIYGTGLNDNSATGIWKKLPGGWVEKIVQGDTTAPGTGGARFRRLLSNTELNAPVCDGFGRLAFLAKTSNRSRDGIWFGNEDGLDLVAIEGHHAPGGASAWERLEKPFVSAAGHVAFRGTLEAGSAGLWMTDIDGALHKIVAEGDEVMIRGRLETVTQARFVLTSSSVGRLSALNRSGEAVFLLTSAIGQTLMIAKVPIPQDALRPEIFAGGGGLQLRIASRRPLAYQLQTSAALDAWEDRGTAVEGTGADLLFDLPADGPQKFYRLAISARE